MNLKSIVERHAVWAYFGLVFALAWGGIFLVVQTVSPSGDAASPAMIGIVALPMLLAPGLAGITLTALAEGRAGLRALWARMTHWRVDARWYLVALFVMPLAVLAILAGLALLVTPAYAPVLSLLGVAGLAAGYLEEFGWTGFATPRLLSVRGPLAAGLVLGVLWGLWHGLADYVIRGHTHGAFWPVAFALFVLAVTAWRVLMVWVYHTTQSGLVAQLMHFSYTGSLALFIPLDAISHAQDALIYVVLAVALWIGVAALALRPRRAIEPQAELSVR